MTINDKVNEIVKICGYKFNGNIFTLFKDDLIRIYDRVNGVCIFSVNINSEFEIPDELANSIYEKEELVKLEDKHFAVCFYLKDESKKVEKPISARITYV